MVRPTLRCGSVISPPLLVIVVKPLNARIDSAGGLRKAESARPQGDDAEQRDATDLDDRHDDRKQADGAVARDVHEEGKQDDPDRQQRHQRAAGDVERAQDIGGECPRHEAFGNHHRQRHQKGCGGGNRARPVGFLQDHRDAARGRPGIRHLDVAVGAEGRDDRPDHEGQRKIRPCQLGDLAGQGKYPGPDHHARAHADRAAEADGALIDTVIAV